MLIPKQPLNLQNNEPKINEEERRESEPYEETIDLYVLIVIAEMREDAFLETVALPEVHHYQIHHVKLYDAHHEADQRDVHIASLQSDQRQDEDCSADHAVQQSEDRHEISHALLFGLHHQSLQ